MSSILYSTKWSAHSIYLYTLGQCWEQYEWNVDTLIGIYICSAYRTQVHTHTSRSLQWMLNSHLTNKKQLNNTSHWFRAVTIWVSINEYCLLFSQSQSQCGYLVVNCLFSVYNCSHNVNRQISIEKIIFQLSRCLCLDFRWRPQMNCANKKIEKKKK